MVEVTVPSYLSATCPACGVLRTFILDGGGDKRLVGVYACEDCGRGAHFDLSP